MLALLWLPAAAALSPVPGPLPLTDDERDRLQQKEIVVREAGPDGVVIGLAFVAAPPEVVIAEVVNLPARVEEVGPIQSLDLYLQEPGRSGARWTVGLMGLSMSFHILYEFDQDLGWCTFSLDESRENDLAASAGSYQAYAHEAGSLLIYRSSARGADEAPSWLRQMLESRGLREQVGGIRARSEAR